MAAAEKKERLARQKKTMASLARLTAPDPEPIHESTDTSEAEQNVTAAILATLPMKKSTEKSPAAKGPITRGRKNKKD